MQMTRNQHGFTLVEVMVVVAIIGLITGIAVPAYMSWKPGYVYRAAVSRIRGDINKAKMKAVETRNQWRIMFCGNSYQLIEGDRPRNSRWTVPPAYTANPSCPMGAAEIAAFRAAGRQVIVRDFTNLPGARLTADCNSSPTAITSGSEPWFTLSPRGTATSSGPVSVYMADRGDCSTFTISTAGRILRQ
ncbi:MAG TPA: pilin [Desulfobulbus sp.]|nr:pilin [Desulfobulbus sp.]